MFCSQCGTQIDQTKNFCKNCGARVGRAAEPVSSEPTVQPASPPPPTRTAATARAAQGSNRRMEPRPVPSPRDNGRSNKMLILAVGVGVVVLGAAGVYFVTVLFQPSANLEPPRVEQPIARSMDAPPLPSFEESKDPGALGDNSSASASPPNATVATPMEAPKPLPEITRKPAAETEVPPPSPKSKFHRAGQDAPVQGRANRPQPAPSASRGGAGPGVYETLRSTPVYEDPSAAAKVLASIPAGTRVNVVSSNGEWLEVHSRRGNPPGFIRRDDAAFIGR
jgi:cytoskeletal protein RodZ